jgi:hypothetical protein
MPGMFIGDGDTFGVGDGVGIEWPVCCANAECPLPKNVNTSNSLRSVFILSTRLCQKPDREGGPVSFPFTIALCALPSLTVGLPTPKWFGVAGAA